MWTKVEFEDYAAAWQRRAPGDWTFRGVRAIAYAMAGHELHHLADIRRQDWEAPDSRTYGEV